MSGCHKPLPVLMTEELLGATHAAAKIIETDGADGYWTCRQRFGQEVADILLVAFLRRAFNPLGHYPEPDDLEKQVNEFLAAKGLIGK